MISYLMVYRERDHIIFVAWFLHSTAVQLMSAVMFVMLLESKADGR